jgi:hypothetical protein
MEMVPLASVPQWSGSVYRVMTRADCNKRLQEHELLPDCRMEAIGGLCKEWLMPGGISYSYLCHLTGRL